MSEPRHSKVIIIGSGAAGYTAAIYAARAMLNPLLIAGLQPGGQLTITTDVENYPGFADVIQGPWLMEQMRAQAEHVGTEIVSDIIVEADLSARPFTLKGDSGAIYTADSVIIATGARIRTEIPRLWRLCLCHLRRIFLSRKRGFCHWRRQYRRGGSAVPDQFRKQGHAGSPA